MASFFLFWESFAVIEIMQIVFLGVLAVYEIISAQLELYQRFSRYIDLPTKTDNTNLLPLLLYKVKITLHNSL
ncbi:hypothetical protein C0U42_03115 [Bacillus cereus]|nr:hypothetical protein C0U42_03115 [Bacillus cereus]